MENKQEMIEKNYVKIKKFQQIEALSEQKNYVP